MRKHFVSATTLITTMSKNDIHKNCIDKLKNWKEMFKGNEALT